MKNATDLLPVRNAVWEALRDAGFTGGDSGAGMGSADLWVTWEGREYFIQIALSAADLAREAVS